MKKSFTSNLLLTTAIVFGLFQATNLSAQSKAPKISYKSGAEVDSDLKGSDEIFSDIDGTVYLTGGSTNSKLKNASGQNMIEKISPDLKTVTTDYIFINIPDEDGPVPAFQFAMLNTRLYAFAASTDFDAKNIYAVEVDKNTLKAKGKEVKIFNHVASSIYDFPMVIASENEEQIMIIKFESSENGGIDDIKIKVFEGSLESSWEQKITAPFGTTSFTLTDLKLYDDGTLMMIGYDRYDADFSKKALKEGKPNYMDHIITLAEHSETVIDRKIEVGDVFTKSLQADILPDGRIIASGFYSDYADDNLTMNFTDGIFYASFEKGKTSPTIVKTSKFNAEFVADQMEEGLIHSNKNNDRLKNSYVRRMFARNDGSITLLAEHIAIVQRGSGAANVYFLEALVFSVSANGEILWSKRIYKDQEQKGAYAIDFAMTREFSFYASVLNDQVLLFFNDDIDSKTTENSDEPEVFTGEDDCNLICVSVGPKGEISKQLVHEFDKTTPSPCVCMFHQTGKSDFIFFGWGHNIADNINGIHIGE